MKACYYVGVISMNERQQRRYWKQLYSSCLTTLSWTGVCLVAVEREEKTEGSSLQAAGVYGNWGLNLEIEVKAGRGSWVLIHKEIWHFRLELACSPHVCAGFLQHFKDLR